MVDQNWIKNLATSELTSDNLLSPKNHEEIQQNLMDKVEQIMTTIFKKTNEAIATFNFHSAEASKIKIYPVQAKKENDSFGFVLLLGHVQGKVIYQNGCLSESITYTAGYKNVAYSGFNLSPFADQFGGLLWKKDNQVLWSEDLIVQQLLEDIVTAYKKTSKQGVCN